MPPNAAARPTRTQSPACWHPPHAGKPNLICRTDGLGPAGTGRAARPPLDFSAKPGVSMTISRRMVMGGVALAGFCPALPTAAKPSLHQRLICLDTHLDTPANLARPGWDMMRRHSVATDFTQVDYPRMV